MRPLAALVLAVALALPACAGGPGRSAGGDASEGTGYGPSLSAELFPFTPRTVSFAAAVGPKRIRATVEPADGGADMLLERTGQRVWRIEVRREGEALYFSDSPSSRTDLIRIGARPGSSWPSGPQRVRFEGWERIEAPGGTFDAARISSTTPGTFDRVRTWWFAEGVGLVRILADWGPLFSEEYWLARAATQ